MHSPRGSAPPPRALVPSSAAEENHKHRASGRAAAVRLVILAALLVVLVSWVTLGGGGHILTDMGRWVDSLGFWGPFIFAVCYALAVTALLPGSLLTASAGALFGISLGAASVVVGATAGAALSFGLARWLGRPAVARRTGSGRLASLDAYLSRRGFVAVLVLRLLPLFPFNAVNYAAGVSGIRFVPYLAATLVGIVPGTLVYTGLGGGLGDPGSALLWIAVAGLLILSGGGWWAARLLRSRSPEIGAPTDDR